MFFSRKHNALGFTVVELAIVLLLLTTLTLIIYKPLMSRMRVNDLNTAVSEAQGIADFAESIRTKWLQGSTKDPATGVVVHTYNTLTDQPVNSLPFDGVNLFPANNPTGLPYKINITNDQAFVSTTMKDYQLQDFSTDLPIYALTGAPLGPTFSVQGRPSFNVVTTQTRKTKFDKSLWYLESIR